MSLVPCPKCHRHHRSTEASCPFCHAAVNEPFDITEVAIDTPRLTRAAIFAFTTLAAACQSTGDNPSPLPPVQPTVQPPAPPVQPTVQPPAPTVQPQQVQVPVLDPGAVALRYGAPPIAAPPVTAPVTPPIVAQPRTRPDPRNDAPRYGAPPPLEA